MNYNEHSAYKGLHAFLSPSRYHWTNYSPEKLEEVYRRRKASELGTRLHEFATEAIMLGIRMPDNKQTLNMYINDAIGYRMKPELLLFYSPNCFGTVDAISYRNKTLRIHDLKTGVTPANMRQLEVYTALFCLEYGAEPNDIDIELRIYQSDEIIVHDPLREDILYIMQKIISFDKQIETILMTEGR